MKILIVAILALTVAAGATLANTNLPATFSFDRDSLRFSPSDPARPEYPGCDRVGIGVGFSLPARAVLLPLGVDESAESIRVTSVTSVDLTGPVNPADLSDAVTSDAGQYSAVVDRRNETDRFGFQPVSTTGEITLDRQRYAELLVFPVTVDAAGGLTFHEALTIGVAGRAVSSDQLLERAALDRTVAGRLPTGAASTGPEYLIVTSAALAAAMQPLAKYKNEIGYVTSLQLIEDILPTQTGRDDAERLREYLKIFCAAGGRYVLLAGDETVLPIRYAYHNNTTVVPSLGESQLCDLYFADLTGEWDVDNDGVWGEKYADRPDIVPELLVGRLPINSADEASNYIEKLIRYETDPGGGDRSYLERAFFFSSDQMRDYGDGGQHRAIAEAYPAYMEIDTVSAVESADGADPAPNNLSPSELEPVLGDGFGIINVIAHGRTDGFVLKSSGYNEWPKTYFLAQGGTGHGSFESVAVAAKPAFYYSLACNNGGFDMDQPPMNQTSDNMAQDLIGSRGGAVGMVAYSRWGWISSSHILQKAFFDSLFAHPERPAVEALYASKAVLYYYTDLVYGLNYFGDPTLRVYTRTPDKPDINAKGSNDGLSVKVTVEGTPIADCNLVLAEDGAIIGEFTTDGNGDLVINYAFNATGEYRLSSVPTEGVITQIDYIPSLVLDVDDPSDGPLLPESLALHQNYPNPFNPSTAISFDLPVQSPARLTVFNILGQVVATLVDEPLPAGTHEVIWDGSDEAGQPVASGVYFYRLETVGDSAVRKMVMLK